jgi:hypothetical protein
MLMPTNYGIRRDVRTLSTERLQKKKIIRIMVGAQFHVEGCLKKFEILPVPSQYTG